MLRRDGAGGELLIAIASPDNAERKQSRDTAEKLFREYNVKTYREEQIDELRQYAESAL